ncbi:hypothetical protein IGI04_040441, partial [Brassica rapa subsp. trilocularis]
MEGNDNLSLFALHKSLSGFGVSIGDIRGTWKHLGSKREWKMLFRRAKHQSGVRERRATPAPEESKAGATSCTEVIHPLQAQLLVDDFHYAERPMAATSLTRGGCRATSGATSSTRARFGEVKHVFRSDLWERPSAPAPRFILCRKLMKEPNFQYNNYQQKFYSNNQQGGYQQRQNTHQGNYQPRQNTPPGFNNTNNQSTQAQGSSSQAPTSDTSVDAMRAKHQSGVRERRATPAPEESKAGATSCTEVIHPLQAQLLVDDFHYAERPMAATSLTRGGCRATSGATSSTRAHFGEVKHVFRSDLWERPSAPAPRFGVSIGDIRGTWKHLGSKREWKMLFRRAKHQSGVRERRATPAPEESKAGATSCTEVIHPLQAQLLVDDFHYAERPMAATSLTRGGCRATSGATSSTRAHFGEVKHVFRSDLWERPSAPAP